MPDLRGLSARDAHACADEPRLVARGSREAGSWSSRRRRPAASSSRERRARSSLDASPRRRRERHSDAGRSPERDCDAAAVRSAGGGAAGRTRGRAPRLVGHERFAQRRAGIGVRRAEGPQGGRHRVRARRHRARVCRRRRRGAGACRRGSVDALDSGVRRQARARRALRGVLRQPERGPRAGRDHGHERQDDDVVPSRVDLRGRRRQVRPHRDGGISGRRPRSRGNEDDTGGAGTAADAARHGRCGLRRVRDRSIVARTVAAPCRLPPLQRRGVHQPHARSSRFSSGHGGLLQRRSAGSSRC